MATENHNTSNSATKPRRIRVNAEGQSEWVRSYRGREVVELILKFGEAEKQFARFCIFYDTPKAKDCRTPWFSNKSNAQRALEIMQAKYGKRSAIIFID